MIEFRRRQFPEPSASPGRLVTLSEEGTSLLFGHLLEQDISLWRAHLPGLGAIHDDATRFEQLLQRWSEATGRLTWHLQEELSVKAACSEFASLLKDVPEVQSIVCSFDGPVTIVWTYLDGKPFDAATRYRIYEAEQQILRHHPGAEIDFQLVNLAEYSAELRSGLRASGSVFYERGG